MEQVRQLVAGEPVPSRLALLSKEQKLPSGQIITKRRLIMDCRRSGVNTKAQQNQRIVLPNCRDLVRDGVALARNAKEESAPGELEGLVIDVKDAFYQVPLAPCERKYAVAAFTNAAGECYYYVFLRLPMGAKNSPQVWGRTAALLARLLQGMLPPARCRLEVYVDDPELLVYGSRAERQLYFGSFVLALAAVGCKLSWHKAERGCQFVWIGAAFSLLPGEI
eukprot:6468714-Amphidinium_carterae.1